MDCIRRDHIVGFTDTKRYKVGKKKRKKISWKPKIFLSFLGEGNWEDISKGLNNKSAADCKIHYETQYLDNELFPSIPVNSCDRQDQPVIFAPSDDLESVLRPVKTSNLHKELAGMDI